MTYIRYVTRPGNPSNSNPSSLTPAGFAQANDLLTTIGGIPRVIANAAGNAISDFGESISNLF